MGQCANLRAIRIHVQVFELLGQKNLQIVNEQTAEDTHKLSKIDNSMVKILKCKPKSNPSLLIE